MIQKTVFFSGLFTLLFSSVVFVEAEEITIDDHTLVVQDLYINTYESFDDRNVESLMGNAFFAVAESMNTSTEDLERMLLEKSDLEFCKKDSVSCVEDLMEKACPIPKGQNLWFIECQKALVNRLQDEYSRQEFQEFEHIREKASQAFINGTLQDTGGRNSFDIIVDLNIIDTILFGDNMTTPSNGSPFLPSIFDASGENFSDGNNDGNDQNEGSDTTNVEDENDGSDDDSLNDEESEDTEEVTEEVHGFCLDPGAVFFTSTVTKNTYTVDDGFNSHESLRNNKGEGYTSASLGNIIVDQIKYSGGTYPDLSSFGGNDNGCEEGEKSFFQGRLCIPEFCNDIICIKINLKTGRSEDTAVYLDCVECHILRGIEFLSPFIGTIGQNTPNSNPQEAYFLAAFANMFKNVTSQITLKPKKLPFMVYDDSLADQHKQDQSAGSDVQPEETVDKLSDEDVDEKIFNANERLYHEMIANCPEMNTVFEPNTGFALFHSSYCVEADAQRDVLAKKYYGYTEEQSSSFSESARTEQNNQRTEGFHNVVQPFFMQMSAGMVTINAHLQDIDPAIILKNAQHCSIKN